MDGQACATRVLVRGLPQLLQDLVQRLLGDNSEIELVEADPGPETALVLRQEHVDVLITGPDLAGSSAAAPNSSAIDRSSRSSSSERMGGNSTGCVQCRARHGRHRRSDCSRRSRLFPDLTLTGRRG